MVDCIWMRPREDSLFVEPLNKVGSWFVAEDDKTFSQIAEQMAAKQGHFMRSEYYAALTRALQYVTDYSLVIDAGGHIGTWAMEMAKTFRVVHSFEPIEENYKYHIANCLELSNVVLHKVGLSDELGSFGYVKGENTGAGYLQGEGDIKVITIDSLELPSCGFLKADVEGFESRVLKGAEETIKAYNPVILIEEKGLGSKNHSLKDAEASDFLASLGYEKKVNLQRDSVYIKRGK